ncbi:MAG: glutaredoxin family protein [Anaerolineae bacterium]|nr:glutaredoxin family protein [Anaerolineae bacterium]
MLTVTLYTKDGCGLCDEVKAELAELAQAFPHKLQEVDITKDSDLFARYRFTIPVVKMGEQTLKAPISKSQLQTALQNESKK